MPTRSISIFTGVAFLGFAGWTLRSDTLSDDEAQVAQMNKRSAAPDLRTDFDLSRCLEKSVNAFSRVNLQRLGVPASLDLQAPCAM